MKLLLTAILILLVSFSAFPQSRQQSRDRAAINSLVKTVKELASGDLRCRTSADCTVIPTGSRACGGPSDYVLTSKKNANLEEVEALAQKITEKEHAYNVNYRVISICSIMRMPQPGCEKKVCTVR